jgi:hypothetical protein
VKRRAAAPGAEWAVTATLDHGGYHGITVENCSGRLRFTDAADQGPWIHVTPFLASQLVTGLTIVARWTVETSAATPTEAFKRLHCAEPLLVERVRELAFFGFGSGERWFRLADGKLLDPCGHPDAVPVDTLWTRERVAWLCPECDAQLPADWA